MAGFLVRTLVSALGLWLASLVVPGLEIHGTGTLVAAAVVLGVVNAIVRPMLVFLTLPITVLSLGFFLVVINAAMLGLVASLVNGFVLADFRAAMLAAVIVSVTGWLASWFVGPRGRFEILVIGETRG